jgi:hypothetical protein
VIVYWLILIKHGGNALMKIHQDHHRVLAITNSKGQAFVETMFAVPFFVMFLFFIYQSYASIHKAQIAQKYLKSVIESALNRFDVTHTDYLKNGGDPAGKFAFYYDDDNAGNVSYAIKDATAIGMLTVFASQKQKQIVKDTLKTLGSKSTLGMCMGGGMALQQTTSPNVLDNANGSDITCEK